MGHWARRVGGWGRAGNGGVVGGLGGRKLRSGLPRAAPPPPPPPHTHTNPLIPGSRESFSWDCWKD